MKPNHNLTTAGLSSSSASFKTRSSPSHSQLPSVSVSANSFSSLQASNLHSPTSHHHQHHHHNKNNPSRVSSPPKSPWKQESRLESVSRQNTDASAVTLSSVHWSSDGDAGKKTDDSGRRRSRKTPDPAQLWARYVRTTAAEKFYAREPSKTGRVHFHEGEGGGAGGGGGGKDDGRYSKKISLPCPSNAACCFCVYSRQLGPVRVYMSSLRPADSRARHNRRKLDSAAKAEELPSAGDKNDKPKVVFLKERWLRSSAPSGEVIVPEIPEPEVHKPSYHDRCLNTDNIISAGDVVRELHWSHGHRVLANGMSVPTRARAAGLVRKPDSSIMSLGSYAPHFFQPDATTKAHRSSCSVSFQDDVDLMRIPARWAADSYLRNNGFSMPDVLSRSRTATSRSAPAVYVAAGSPRRKGGGKSAGKIALYDYVRCPDAFSKPREFPLPVRLVLPVRQGKL